MAHALALQNLRSTIISGNKAAMNTGTGTAASVSVSYGLNQAQGRQFTPGATPSTTTPVPAAPATFSGVGWEMDAVIDADRIQFLDAAVTINVRLDVTGETTGPNVTYHAILFVNGSEIGRHALAKTLYTGGPVVEDISISAAEFDGTLVSTANPKLQLEFYSSVSLAAISLGATTHTLTVNDGTSNLDPPDWEIRAQRSASATAIGVAAQNRLPKLARSAVASGVPSRAFVVKPLPRSAVAVGVATQSRLPKLARSATAVGVAAESRLVKLTRSAIATGLPTMARRIEAFRVFGATAVGVPAMARAVIAVRSFSAIAIGVPTGRIEVDFEALARAAALLGPGGGSTTTYIFGVME